MANFRANVMQKNAEIKMEGDVLYVSGDLDFSNVMSVYQASIKTICASSSSVTIDFSRLLSANSAALAIIVNWMKLANKNNVAISFRNMSGDIISLAKSSGLDKLIQPLIV